MKFIYVANHNNTGSDATEKHIAKALGELGHTVVCLEENTQELPKGDVLLFHKWNNHALIKSFEGKKVVWYFDKVRFNNREAQVEKMLPLVDHFFLTDGTYAKENGDPKLKVLRQGVDPQPLGKPRSIGAKIGFVGSLYGERKEWFERLKRRFNGEVGVFTSFFNRDLYDLCASVEIFVAPEFPSDDNYWSNRVYLITGSGGFLIHPRLKGLEMEFPCGVVFYDNEKQMYDQIDYYLSRPDKRKKIQAAGYALTLSKYSFRERLKQLCKQL